MANTMWLTLNGQAQGLISAGCASVNSIGNKSQTAHRDQIMVMAVNHGMSRVQNVNHQCLTFIKPVDKSSPLLGKAITDNETLNCEFSFYRTSPAGLNECYYAINLLMPEYPASIYRCLIPLMTVRGSQRKSLSFRMSQLPGSTLWREPAHTAFGMSEFIKG